MKVYLATYVCIILFVILSIILYKTRLACGSACENPQAADSLGINVQDAYIGTTISGALAGMGGFGSALTTANCSSNGDVAGFGFLALAVMIFGNWRPLNIAGASLLFGLFKCIAAAYSSIDINGDGVYWLAEIGISSHLYRMLPYIITLLVLAFTSKKSRAPKAEGIPDKGPQIRAAAPELSGGVAMAKITEKASYGLFSVIFPAYSIPAVPFATNKKVGIVIKRETLC